MSPVLVYIVIVAPGTGAEVEISLLDISIPPVIIVLVNVAFSTTPSSFILNSCLSGFSKYPSGAFVSKK
ncbi:hypothetical protein D3C73_1516310 [compost metagenome]